MMTIILLGIVASTVAEIVTALNKKLQGTVLKGDAAFLVAFGMAFVGAIVKEVTMPGFNIGMLGNWSQLTQTFGEIFSVSQLYFMFVVQKLNLDVQSPVIVSGTTTAAQTSPSTTAAQL